MRSLMLVLLASAAISACEGKKGEPGRDRAAGSPSVDTVYVQNKNQTIYDFDKPKMGERAVWMLDYGCVSGSGGPRSGSDILVFDPVNSSGVVDINHGPVPAIFDQNAVPGKIRMYYPGGEGCYFRLWKPARNGG
jgi:hypothetical protein